MSRGITLTLLSGLLLTACITSGGCGRRSRDPNWYDAHGNRIAENWQIDPTGKREPDPYPYDSYGRPWVYDAQGNLVPQDAPAGTSTHSSSRSSIPFIWGGSGYRSGSSGTSYRTGSSGPSSRSGGGSSSISRGGFG